MGACLGVESQLPTRSQQMDLHDSAAVSSSAYIIDMELQPIDDTLDMSSILKEAITDGSLNMNQLDVVVSIILEHCKKDVWKNGELSRLVEEYFRINRPETLLHNCTRTLEMLLNEVQRMALRCFKEEDEAEMGEAGKYARTTLDQELKNLINAAEGPFGEELQSVNRQQLSVKDELDQHKRKVDKKLKSIKTWRRVSIITFASAFAAIIISSVVAAAMRAPQRVAAALAAAAAIPVPLIGKWFDSLWKKHEDALKGEEELISAMIRLIIAIMELDSIRVRVVKQLKIIQSYASQAAAKSDLGDEEAVKIDIGNIKREFRDFMKNKEILGRCTRNTTNAGIDVLQKINNYPVKK